MKKRKIFKTLLLATCCAICTAGAVTMTACNNKDSGGISFVEEEVKTGPQFLEGSLADVTVGDTVVLEEYIEYVTDSDYTIIITDENGKEWDVTDRLIWKPEVAGTYTITYTIAKGDSKGTSTFILNVANPTLTWSFSLQNKPYNYGDTLVFNKYFSNMNIYASLREWSVVMDSVEVDDEVIDLTGKKEYTFQSLSDHLFCFHIESPDGQRCEGRELISIRYIDQEYMQTLTDMGITTYGELYVEKGNYTMVTGSYANGGTGWLKREYGPHNLPYIAYNGDYGFDSYVKVDFTGKNMPILSFFRDDNYSESVFDGGKGLMYTSGFNNNSGIAVHNEMCSRGTLYGPYMIHTYDRGSPDTTTLQSTGGSSDKPFAGSLNSLVDGTRYRMIAGFSGVDKGIANKLGTTEPVDTLFAKFECVIINLDTKEIFSRFTMRSYGLQALGFTEIPLDVENNQFFKGNIVMYGNYGIQTKLDTIYPIITGKTFDEVCDDELQVSEFKDDAQTFFTEKGVTLNVSDYVDTTAEDYKFFYRDEAGNTYNVEGETFTLADSGSYTLYYTDGTHLCGTMTVFVAEFSPELLQWVRDNDVTFYGLDTLTDDLKATLNAGTIGDGGTYAGPNGGNLINQSYLAFNGEYGLNDYVAFDFTGKNMPEVAFFAQKYNNSMYYQDGGKQGIVFANGITNYKGELDTGILGNGTMVNIDSPFMMESIDTWFVQNGMKASQLARANLVDGTRYRVVLGYTANGTAAIQLNWYLYNLDTHEMVEQGDIKTWGFFNGADHGRINGMTQDDLLGSIVLYGKFGTTLTIDKLYGVYEDTTMDEVVSALNADEKYTVTFKDAAGNVLKTLTNVAYGSVVSYDDALPTPDPAEDDEYVYSYVWAQTFEPIKGNTVYNLKLVSQSKSGITLSGVTEEGDKKIFAAGSIGNGASYTKGQQNGGYVTQSYLGMGTEYALNDYVVFDFTGKNLPEIAFFANNYDDSMYANGTSKQGIVVYTGITTWDGQDNAQLTVDKENGTYLNYGFPYMLQDAANGAFTQGAFKNSALGRANLVDGTHYRLIMGFAGSESAITLHWCLYNLDTDTVVEENSMTTWNFFTGSEAAVGNMTLDDLSGAIVLYGKFGTTLTIDKLWGVYEDTSIADIKTEMGM